MSEQESNRQFRSTCHFFNAKNMTPAQKHLKEIYCIEWMRWSRRYNIGWGRGSWIC
jgi:hypothetical protein